VARFPFDAPDPERPGFTVAGDAHKGDPKAKVVVVEFNDFQCPACNKHALEAQPAIDEALVDTGKVFWVDKHLPLREHEYALVAAVAAECAGEQGQYWSMNERLHAESARWASDDPDAVMVDLAKDLGLDTAKFRACLTGRRGLERVVDDIYDAQGVVTSTPRFVILHDGRGAVTGPLPAAQFIELLEKRLEEI
jgi:protein-disulfide isomerase